MLFVRFLFSVLWVTLGAVLLSNCTGITGYECPISINALRVAVVSCPFSKADTISHEVTDKNIL